MQKLKKLKRLAKLNALKEKSKNKKPS